LDKQRGEKIAAMLAGAWRHAPDRMQSSGDELAEITPLLLKSGTAALAWWRVRGCELRRTPAALQLQQAYRHHSLQATFHESEIKRVFATLGSARLEPLLGKGWAIAQVYPEEGLRPYGDVDLFVRAEQYAETDAALRKVDGVRPLVDLHRGAAELDDRSFDDLYARSRTVALGKVAVRMLGPEDHLRLLCLHMLRHGAWRPLWLCDVAAALEARPPDFDWEYFLSGNRKRTDWAACAIGLAHQLLGARVDGTPVEWRAKHLPRWLAPTVLRQWGAGQVAHGLRRPMATYLRRPEGLVEALRVRWPNAIEATVGVRGRFNEWPRLPFQIGECVARATRFAAQLRTLLRQPQ
jgi:hypothetical protein